MNTKNRMAIFYFVLAVVCILGLNFFSVAYLSNKLDEKFSSQIEEVMGNTYQQQAVMDLCDARGRVEQIQKLYSASQVSENILINELRYISSFKDLNNPYLKDFAITISSSNVGEVCEEIISQINAQIDSIKLSNRG